MAPPQPPCLHQSSEGGISQAFASRCWERPATLRDNATPVLLLHVPINAALPGGSRTAHRRFSEMTVCTRVWRPKHFTHVELKHALHQQVSCSRNRT